MRKACLTLAISFLSIAAKAQKKPGRADILLGEKIYVQHCMPCHQAEGVGVQNMIPPLVKTDHVLGPKATLIKILLNGMNGEIKVNGDIYSNEMPSQAFLTDEEIAAVLTYVRKSFGNKASSVSVGEVKKMRAADKE